MRLIVGMLFCLLWLQCDVVTSSSDNTNTAPLSKAAYAIVIHGGAGTIEKKNMTPELEKTYTEALHAALDVGEKILQNGGHSLDAVEQTIRVLENNPLFNAGKGAVFTHNGQNELDASIMNGADMNAGAVGGVTTVKNPISAARAVMEQSKHVLLTGAGATAFAKKVGLEMVDSTYFFTQKNWDYLQQVQKNERAQEPARSDEKHGTVGCVALDKAGNIAAGTSTGGMTNKRWNRLGDSPIIGAGTYANNATCGVSCTGHGEYFIRYAVAHDISARMEYQNVSLEEAAHAVIRQKLVEVGGAGGAICLDQYGNVAMPFNTPGMYRGYARPNERVVLMYEE